MKLRYVYDCSIMQFNKISKKDNIVIKDALFQFIFRIGMKLMMLQMVVYTAGYCYLVFATSD